VLLCSLGAAPRCQALDFERIGSPRSESYDSLPIDVGFGVV
jgi:hypothetical protein